MQQKAALGPPRTIRHQPDPNIPVAPEWVQKSPTLQRVEEWIVANTGIDHKEPLTYYLPPVHLFFPTNDGKLSDITVQKVHNWLRIRSWCFGQIRQRDRVLMTTAQWRTALEGKYYRTPIDPSKKGQLKVTAEELARLPAAPEDVGRRQRTASGDPFRHKANSNTQHKRVLDRMEINVRLGVYGGFPPYDSRVKEKWGREELDAKAIAASGNRIVAEVVWEISVASFRLELLQLDRNRLESIYKHPDPAIPARRESQICKIWNHGWVRPAWEDGGEHDSLSSPDLKARIPSILQLATVVSSWPGGERFRDSTQVDATNEQKMLDLEYNVFLFYAQEYNAFKGRRPTLPHTQPSSLNIQGF